MTEDLNVPRLELKKYCTILSCSLAMEEEGRSRSPQGRSWGGLLSTQQICLGHKVRVSQCKLELSKAGASTEDEVGQQVFSWSVGEDGWKEGRRTKMLGTGEHCRKKVMF